MVGGSRPRRRLDARWLASVLAGVVLIGGLGVATAEAQVAAEDAGSVGPDPLAWRRVADSAPAVPITVDDRATGRARQLTGRRLLAGSQEMYLRSADAAELLQASRLWQAGVQRLTLRVAERDFRFTAGSRLVTTGVRDTLLPVPVLLADGDLWLPMIFVTAVLAPESGLRIVWDAASARLSLGEVDANVTGLSVRRLTRATSVTVQCREPLSYRASSPQSGLIELKIYGGMADLSRLRHAGAGLVTSIRPRQEDGHVILTIGVDDLVTRYRTATRDEGREIVLTLEEEQVAALPDPVPRGQAELALPDTPVDVTRRLEVRTVVVDPGHGGTDPGVAGVNGVLEKDVNLEVGLILAEELRRRDFDVVLTRRDDSHLSLAERAEIANAAGGDVFVSLHCNGWFNEGARGFETYFLSPAKSDWSKSVEAVENRDHAEPDDVEFIVWDLVQNRFISASSDLAEVMQGEVTRQLGQPDRGVRQAGFRVLVGAWMPAVLLEMGFLTHPEESRLLGQDHYRRTLAVAIAEALDVYRERVARQLIIETSEDGR